MTNLDFTGEHLKQWARTNGRYTPWRALNDRYKLAVAEILLQKTKAEDVEPVWEEFVRLFPDVDALRCADDRAVLKLVKPLGLGNQRVQRLKDMAEALEEGHISKPVPGLGPYGSAILALSQGLEPASPPVDGNIARVVCRLQGFTFRRGEPRKKPEVKSFVAQLLSSQTTTEQKLLVAYSLIDLGATVCKPRKPVCVECPLVEYCTSAFSEGL